RTGCRGQPRPAYQRRLVPHSRKSGAMTETSIEAASREALDDGLLSAYISASTSLSELSLQTLKQGDTFAVFNSSGDILTWNGSPEGLFHNDTRHLSRLDLTLNGRPPLLLSSNIQD